MEFERIGESRHELPHLEVLPSMLRKHWKIGQSQRTFLRVRRKWKICFFGWDGRLRGDRKDAEAREVELLSTDIHSIQ